MDVGEAMDVESLHADEAPMRDWSGDSSSVKWAATSSVRGERCVGCDRHAAARARRRTRQLLPRRDGRTAGACPTQARDRRPGRSAAAPEQHLHDVAIERKRRRSQQGYATPADARAFLQMARQPRHTRSEASATGSITVNPIVTAYFRAAGEAPESSSETARSPERMLTSSTSASPSTASRSTDAHVTQPTSPHRSSGHRAADRSRRDAERPRALLEAAELRPAGREARAPAASDGVTCATRTRPRTSRAVVSSRSSRTRCSPGCSVQSRPFTPQEASDAAAGICNLGLEHWPRAGERDLAGCVIAASSRHGHSHTARYVPPDSFLIDHDLVDSVRSRLVGASPGCEPVRGGTAHLDARQSSLASIATSSAGSSRCGARS